MSWPLALLILTVFLRWATPVSACEGDCIVGITNAFLSNYSRPVNTALVNLADSIVTNIIQNQNSNVEPLTYLNPIITEYNKRAYDFMETAIFPKYFHGKCQDSKTGVEPAGCPKPDCNVVCGTPGSMVHFYSKLKFIAFDANTDLFNEIIAPESSAYQEVEKAVLTAVASHKRRRLFRFMRSSVLNGSSTADTLEERGDEQIKSELRSMLNQFHLLLTVVCGGGQDGKANGIPFCSWEDTFKPYILSFP